MEIWKDIQGYENSYEVSNLGRVRSKSRKRPFGRGFKVYEGKILKQATDKDGYKKISLSKEGKKKRFMIHRLVANEFIENPNDLPVINHKDGIKDNNNVINLEWVTYSENTQHAFNTGLCKPSNGGTNKHVAMVDNKTGITIKEFDSIAEASEYSGHSIPRISYSANKEANSVEDFVWRFK